MSKPILYHPRSLHVRITSGCNLGCTMCERELLPVTESGAKQRSVITFHDGRPDLDLSKDAGMPLWETVRDQWMPYVWNMELGGLGEPTIAKLFPAAAKDIVEAGRSLFFFTNGHYLGKKKVIDSVGQSPRVSVSIDAGTPEVYAQVRKGDLSEVVKSVGEFRKAVPGAIINSQFTATADNIDDLPNFVRLCAKLGIGMFANKEELSIVGAHHHVTERTEKSIRFCQDRVDRAVAQARAIAETEGIWMMANLPKAAAESNKNAIDDGSDPRGIRRYSDRLYGEITCAISGETGITEGAPRPDTEERGPHIRRFSDTAQRSEIRVMGTAAYIDHTGEVWTCLARHKAGTVDQGFQAVIEDSEFYQSHLRNYDLGRAGNNPHCKACINPS